MARTLNELLAAVADRRKGGVRQLARLCGVNRSTLYRYAQGTRRPDAATIQRLADALGVHPSTVRRALRISQAIADLS